jgi:hypothetical protein
VVVVVVTVMTRIFAAENGSVARSLLPVKGVVKVAAVVAVVAAVVQEVIEMVLLVVPLKRCNRKRREIVRLKTTGSGHFPGVSRHFREKDLTMENPRVQKCGQMAAQIHDKS